MTAQHTPGPWNDTGSPDSTRSVVANGPLAIASVHPVHISDNRRPITETLANARLIAASPDLLEALTWALGVIEICEKNAPDIDWSIGHFGRKKRAKATLTKATQ